MDENRLREIVREELQRARPIIITGLAPFSYEDFMRNLQAELFETAKQESKFKHRHSESQN